MKENGSAASVQLVDGRLSITSSAYGHTSTVKVAGGVASDYYLPGSSEVAGNDVAGTINGKPALGSGRRLTAATGDPSEGLSLLVTSDTTGDRGTATVSKGFASSLNELLTKMLDSTGSLSARTSGLDRSLTALQNDSEKIALRLAETEKRYRAQYTALDTLMSQMSAQSATLSRQLASIAAI